MADEVITPEPQKPNDPPAPAARQPEPPNPTGIDPEVFKAERRRREDAETALALSQKRAQDLENEKAEGERKRLEEEGNFKQLAAQERERATAAELRITEIENASRDREAAAELRIALLAEGVTDPDIATLVDRSSIKFEGGRFIGVTEAVKAFKEAKPHFFGAPRPQATSLTPAQPAPAAARSVDVPVDVTRMTKEEYAEHKRKVISGRFTSARRSA